MNISTLNKSLCFLAVGALASAFQQHQSLKGTYQFVGGIYHGKKEGAPKEYALHRKYDDAHYQAFALEKGEKPQKYEAGNYALKGDTCIDTETFSAQPSQLTNIPIHYTYTLKNDTLTLKGKLPTGMEVEEYWKRIK